MTTASLLAKASVAVCLLAGSASADPRRIVSVGGAVTEIVFELGGRDDLAAVDTTSSFPAQATDALPKVGYMRQLSAEGVLSMRPTEVLAVEGSGPADVLKLIRDAGVPVTMIPEQFSASGVETKVRAVGKALGREGAAEKLAVEIGRRFETLKAGNAAIVRPVRVLFALALQSGRPMAAGSRTAADEAIRLAGAVNAVEGFDGYKGLSDEAIIASAPDVIVVMDRGGQRPEDVFGYPTFAMTPAGMQKRLVAMDGIYLLGFGPRTPEAATDLRARLYPAIAFPALDPRP